MIFSFSPLTHTSALARQHLQPLFVVASSSHEEDIGHGPVPRLRRRPPLTDARAVQVAPPPWQWRGARHRRTHPITIWGP